MPSNSDVQRAYLLNELGLGDSNLSNSDLESMLWNRPPPVDSGGGPHTHPQSDVNGLDTSLAGKSTQPHSHAQSEVTSLDTALAGKASSGHGHTAPAVADVTGLSGALAAKSDSGHGHAQSEVTGLTTSLAGKSATGHGHAQSEVTGLSTALTGKSDTTHGHSGFAPTSHSHAQSDVTALSTALAAKSDTTHGHGAAYSAFNHNHAQGDVTGLLTALDAGPDLYAKLPAQVYCSHRCDSNMGPQETVEAAQHSIAFGVTSCLELDVNATLDGVLVCQHNATTGASMTTDVTVNQQMSTNWRNLSLNVSGYGPGWSGRTIRPCFLTDMLKEFGDKIMISIEPKSQAAGDLLPGILNKWIKNKKNIIIPTFTDAFAVPARNAGYNVVGRNGKADSIATIQAAGYTHLNTDLALIDAPFVTALHAVGIKIWAWTLNTQKEVDTAFGYGCDGVITDDTGYVSKTKRLTTDPFDTGVFWHGHQSGGSRNGAQVLGTYPGGGEWGLDNATPNVANCESGVLQGWANPIKGLVNASAFVIDFKARMPLAFGTGSNFAVAISDSDNPAFGGHADVSPTFRGYVFLVQRNGSMQIRYYPGNQTSSNLIATVFTTIPITVQSYRITVTATQLTLTDVTRGNTVTIADSTFRGGYLSFSCGGTATYFSDVVIT